MSKNEFLDLFKLKEFIKEGAQGHSNLLFKAFQKQFCWLSILRLLCLKASDMNNSLPETKINSDILKIQE